MAAEPSGVDNYDVFINFRGADTRHGFVHRLYEGLVAEGMRVFLDDEELNYGRRLDEELPQAINNSKIYITVISKEYASSKWCLRELAEIVRNKQEFKDKKEILPVFYKIKTDDVKLRTDLFKDQLNSLDLAKKKTKLNDLQGKVRDESVEEWAETLKGIADLKAWKVPNDGGYKEDVECCHEIVKRISIILRVKHKPLPKDLIGMEDPVKEVMQLLDIGNPSFQVIGILGMGGSGKTTLAKVVYNKLCDDKFDCCCFMLNVRESLDEDKGSRSCLELQKKLLNEVSHRGDRGEIINVEDGVRRIQLTLKGKKVLMVFDDVSEVDQILRLIGDDYSMFGRESRVIITTRDERVLRNRKFVEFTKIHEMVVMENEHALELFSWHAFGQPIPPEGLSSLSKDAVSLTGRLPLSLEITGSLFFVGGRKNWKKTVEKLKKMPNKKVQERLKISYDDLEEETREIFLDIACFFVDNKASHETHMWGACDFYPELAIEELISMCLLKIDNDDIYRMHDHVKDLGREIVRQEGPEYKEQRSRIWKRDDSIDMLTNMKKENNIKGIRFNEDLNFYLNFDDVENEKWSLRAENFVNLDKLRFLYWDMYAEVQLEGSFDHLLPNLRSLSLPWMNVEQFNATNFNLKKLVVLNLSSSNITESWAGWKEFKDLPSLEVLDLRWCHNLKKTPDLSHCTSLKKLYLKRCDNLEEIDRSITSLPKLHTLDVSLCTSLESLPDSVGETMALQLIELDISCCERLKKLPEFISKQKKLEVLRANWTKEMRGVVPTEIEELTCLSEMSFDHSSICALPSLAKLTRLEKLSLLDCDHLQQLPAELPTSLVELRVRSDSLQSIPDYSNLIHLAVLEFNLGQRRGSDLEELQELNLSWIWRLSKLKSLDLYTSRWSSFIITIQSEEPSVSLLSQLDSLSLKCSVLGTNFVVPNCLPALTMLTIQLYRKTTSLSLPRMNCLTHFWLSDSEDLEQILGLGELESLVSLKILDCDSLERFDDILKLTQLQSVYISSCNKLRVIPGVPGLRSLNSLYIYGCESLESLVGPSESESCLSDVLRVNKSWKISYCPLLKNKLPDDLKRRMEEAEERYKRIRGSGIRRYKLKEEGSMKRLTTD